MIKKYLEILKKYKTETAVVLFSLFFSVALMFSTFSYVNGSMLIATKAWSDFASHIPLIRSFAFGNNFPPQYPLFSGPPIKYHFLFFAFVGILEKLGLRIDYALNIPSALGFFLLLLTIYFFAVKLFKSKAVGVLSILFLLCNSSLDFLNFFAKYPLSTHTLSDIINNNQFMSFGPYDEKIISAFWNLNIYTNQRHLGLSYAVSMLLIYFVIKPYLENKKPELKINVITGIILGITFFLNIAVTLMSAIILGMLFLLSKGKRISILITIIIGGVITFPQYLYIEQQSVSKTSIFLGYLANNSLTITSFINYWFQNLGLNLILIPLGFIIAPKKAKIILIAYFALFVVGNLFEFSPDIAANHKFFNYFVIIGSMFTAYLLVRLWGKLKALRPLVIILVLLLTLSGFIDIFPIFNDTKIALADYPVNKDVAWIMKNTKPDAVFLNTQYLYDNASLAGRKIFLGWPYFAWSQGYDTTTRDNMRKSLLDTNNYNYFCDNIKKYKINYAELNNGTTDATINPAFFNKYFKMVYANNKEGYYIYNLNTCL